MAEKTIIEKGLRGSAIRPQGSLSALCSWRDSLYKRGGKTKKSIQKETAYYKKEIIENILRDGEFYCYAIDNEINLSELDEVFEKYSENIEIVKYSEA